VIHTVRRAFVAFPLGLLLAGCSVNDRAGFRPASAAAPSARTTRQGAVRGSDRHVSSRGDAQPAPRPNEQVADVMAPETRHDVTLDEIRKLVRNGDAVIIDARWPADFALGHVRGAFNMPAGEEDAYMVQLSQNVAPDEFIIIYCNGPRCNSSEMVYEYLVSQGFANMRVFKPGWAAIASARDLR
jgi:rhodanese-related sulfurtransferase